MIKSKEGLTLGQLGEINAGLHAEVFRLNEQVRALAAEGANMRNAIDQTIGWQESVDPESEESVRLLVDLKTPSTNAILREVRAQAVEGFGIYHNFSDKQLIQVEAKKYAARIRKGEQP